MQTINRSLTTMQFKLYVNDKEQKIIKKLIDAICNRLG